ncbi:MAG: hypothetical protein LBR19_04320, partial [Bifidobacteriaceae bacterium]|nr:hypothetical protein [Bifidobacteriaceae bacterium]
ARELAQAQAELSAAGRALTKGRAAGAKRLAQAVKAELAELGMAEAAFEVALVPLAEPGPLGAEGVEFRFTAHRAVALRPLAKGASGGELSRVMLALEVALAGQVPDAAPGRAGTAAAVAGTGQAAPVAVGQPTALAAGGAMPAAEQAAGDEATSTPGTASGPGMPPAAPPVPDQPTLVFDEVDQGVGGKAARQVGERLARLARTSQVIVVTHLAQVAARGDTHLVVSKDGATTTVAAVTGAARQREVARLLSGSEDSAQALAHAAELLAQVERPG